MRVEEKIAYLLQREPVVNFRLGDRYANLIVDNELHRISLKYNGRSNPSETDYKQTWQYRAMVSLGFRTRNGVTYVYDDGEHDVWIRFFQGKVQLIKDNLDYVESVSFRLKKQNKSVFTEGGKTK
jgi:hypothetical protein